MNFWYHMWRVILNTLISLFFDVRVYGRENIPRTGPVLLISNHQSFLDPPLCGMAIRRPCGFMGRVSLFNNPILGWFIRSVNTIPIYGEEGGGSDIKTFKSLISRLKNNQMVVIYPEGSRCYDGTVDEFQRGFELIARKSNATIVPMAIEGAYKALPRGKRFICMGEKIRISYGQPISPETLTAMPRDELVANIAERVTKLHADLRDSLALVKQNETWL